MNFTINPKYKKFEDFLLNIKDYFTSNEHTIHKARNELKIIPYEGVETVVKSFKTPNILRRIIYTYLRDSKAKKSYDYSLKIGDFTPEPIGYVEFYTNSLLEKSLKKMRRPAPFWELPDLAPRLKRSNSPSVLLPVTPLPSQFSANLPQNNNLTKRI